MCKMHVDVLMVQYSCAHITEPHNTVQAVAFVTLKQLAKSKGGSLAACHDTELDPLSNVDSPSWEAISTPMSCADIARCAS